MRYIHQHILRITDQYSGEIPLHLYLKNYYKKHPVLGSRDRKMLTEMAFAWYRCSKAFDKNLSFDKKLEACLFITETKVHQILQLLKAEWQGKHDYFLSQKLALLKKEKISFTLSNIFPHTIDLSKGIEKENWLLSMLAQPDLFIRYRKKTAELIKTFQQKNIPFTHIRDHCFGLPNATKLQEILPEKDYVIQDASSQFTGHFFSPEKEEYWWDCCSGAGGKSLLLKDLQPDVHLTVSDKRESILHNLKERFLLYFKSAPETILLDMTDEVQTKKRLKGKLFDTIICDVPCSGSGTWARTPEQLYFFEEEKTEAFSTLQKTIAGNAANFLKPGGKLIYLTCSVFKKENEDVVNYLTEQRELNCEQMQLINGIERKADSMFAAVLKKK